ncbi:MULTISPECIES: 3TM-type holin [unclassified Janthinobacterium]|uniref:3TM-type holin n=1 Tax=unclassified Janthinobacterium TaxID=2610881 RepID=UPI00034B7A33|nr:MULTISPECIES: 3TM-type holin [unclassified Janthinobacterium]MEC5162398.1 hypothetical protein [Janthinobacterium sp. CG_S6]
MNPLLLGPLADIIKGVITRVWPDPAAQADAQLKLAVMVQNGELAQLAAATDLAKAQIGVNAAEAASTSLFVAGWRPFIGWVCGASLAFKFILGPLLAFCAALVGHPVDLPELDFSEMSTILFALLGLGAMRTGEKIKGVA